MKAPRMSLLRFFIMASGILCLCASTPAEETTESPIAKLLAKDFKEREAAQKQILEDRKKMIEKLIDIIQGAREKRSTDDSVMRAMKLLGEMRAVEAADILARHIAFPHVTDWPHLPPPLSFGDLARSVRESYPAVDALIKIGEPCITQVVRKLGDTDHVTESAVCLSVLLEFKTFDETQALLRREIGKEKDPTRKGRLEISVRDLQRKRQADKTRSTDRQETNAVVPAP